LACAIVRDSPPRVLLAESLDVLQRVVALEVVAQTAPDSFDSDITARIRAALLGERWADALVEWITHTGVAVDVYDEDEINVWTEAAIGTDLSSIQLQFAPLFRDP
jgi:hypothetical protein